ncbi:hypothetical protein AMTRI_Chr02g255790 [Amborella trichopoda]|uniref:tetratricopeptide repeat protein 1 isoform X2 n=1 Tax=Amborella trichopoda TaxID=13333 RepID=UPI0005D453CF|nr:tetratricopeptide repeat protein 1 isoform X2 [Amborella trichopoda]|eukprot:XP_011626633.1 tetratricopeptide repeat protein 1 isoform X2 [Amborella trichopoda]
MVTIEPASGHGDEKQKKNFQENGSRVEEAPSSSLSEENHQTREGEGFETASEGEEGDENAHSYEDALTDEQQIQRAIAQANDSKSEGNKLFGGGNYDEALTQYALALELCPDSPLSSEIRSMCHANRAVCFSKLGRDTETVKECTEALKLNPTYVKALLRRAEANEKLENFEEAIADRKRILELDPANEQSRRAIGRLEPLAAEKREKMKEEMIGKLKDLGNSILGRFGMSVDNFKAVKDPNTGSYSINFQR